jgi:hypothetical protein
MGAIELTGFWRILRSSRKDQRAEDFVGVGRKRESYFSFGRILAASGEARLDTHQSVLNYRL